MRHCGRALAVLENHISDARYQPFVIRLLQEDGRGNLWLMI